MGVFIVLLIVGILASAFTPNSRLGL